jgi:hypothetical protein
LYHLAYKGCWGGYLIVDKFTSVLYIQSLPISANFGQSVLYMMKFITDL